MKTHIVKVIAKYRLYLDEFVYEKLWSVLSAKDRSIITCMAQTGAETVSEIRAKTGMACTKMYPMANGQSSILLDYRK